jgi:hypothetical protein
MDDWDLDENSVSKWQYLHTANLQCPNHLTRVWGCSSANRQCYSLEFGYLKTWHYFLWRSMSSSQWDPSHCTCRGCWSILEMVFFWVWLSKDILTRFLVISLSNNVITTVEFITSYLPRASVNTRNGVFFGFGYLSKLQCLHHSAIHHIVLAEGVNARNSVFWVWLSEEVNVAWFSMFCDRRWMRIETRKRRSNWVAGAALFS